MRAFHQIRAVTVGALSRFWREKTWRMAASITFYVLLMLGPLLALQLQVAGILMDEGAFRDQVMEVIEKAVGEEGAEAVDNLLENFSLPRSGGASYAIGLWMLLFGGVNAMAQLRESLRIIWKVRGENGTRRHRSSVFQTLLDAAFVFAFGLGLVVSVGVNSVLVYARTAAESGPPAIFLIIRFSDLAVSVLLLTGMFAMVFRFLPAKRLPWRQVWMGAGVTAVLFTVGRYLIIVWLSHADIGSVYGSLTFFIILMFWVYVSAQILLFGGCLTYELGEHAPESAVD